ncbi:transposase, partial [bacterium]|nr:transposase [bacterium]
MIRLCKEATLSRATYPTDLSDSQWELLQPFMPDAKPPGRGRPIETDLREVVNA